MSQNLPPTIHTIAYLYTLNAAIDQVSASGKAAPRQLAASLLPEDSLWPYITQILLHFDPIQVRYAGGYLEKLVAVVARGAEQTRNFIPAIQLLHGVILQLDPSSSTFTSTHHTYIRLCLQASAYSEAIDILDRPIYHIPAVLDKQTAARSYDYLCSTHDTSATYLTPNTGLTLKITSRGYLEYYVWGALCYMAVGEYKKAITFLEIVILAPAQPQAASLIQVEAYRKWVLLSLLVYGRVKDIKGSQTSTMRHIKPVAKPYDCIAEAFKSRDIQRLQAEMAEGGDIWNADSNHGLMIEVFHAHRRFAVKNLGKTYAALSVTEVAKQTSPGPNNTSETLSYLRNLIETGRLNATLTPSKDGQDQILRFLPDSAGQKPETVVEQELALKTQQLQLLLKQVSDVDHRTELSKEYIDYLRKLKRTRDEDSKKDSGGGSKGKGASVDEFDEDVMEEF